MRTGRVSSAIFSVVKKCAAGYNLFVKIFGDYHTHSNYSDGKAAVIEMARSGKERGLAEMAMTDHGFRKMFGGLREKTFDKYIGEIESARGEMPVLKGIEANVVSCHGRIDVPQKHAGKFDIVLCGVHINVWYSLGAWLTFCLPNLFWRLVGVTPGFQIRHNTKIVCRAIEKNDIDIWTHMNRYFRVNVVDVARTCAERGTVVELNSRRISFRPIDFERMQKLGCKFIIGSDAHIRRRVGDFYRVEEFLKNCEYNPASIINLNSTWTDWKKGGEKNDDTVGTNQGGVNGQPNVRPEKKGWFRRRGN
jgi:putative hydrolase